MFHMEPQPTQQALAAVVVKSLKDAGLVQRDVVEATGISLATLNRRLTGNSPFLVTELSLLASLVETPVSALLALAEEKVA